MHKQWQSTATGKMRILRAVTTYLLHMTSIITTSEMSQQPQWRSDRIPSPTNVQMDYVRANITGRGHHSVRITDLNTN